MLFSEALTIQFYEWEKRGRGWQLYAVPVDLEPPFVPFPGHVVRNQPIKDDGVHETFLSKLANFFKDDNKESHSGEVEEIDEDVYPFISDLPLSFLHISFPKGYRIRMVEMEHFLLMLSDSIYPISFEIIATSQNIVVQMTCREIDRALIMGQLKSYFPGGVVIASKDALVEGLQDIESYTNVTDYGLEQEFMRHLQGADSSQLDSLMGLFGTFESLHPGEMGSLQIIFKGAINAWAPNIMSSVSDNRGGAFFEDAPDMLPMAKEKISKPLFGVVIRTMAQAPTKERADAISSSLGCALIHVSRSAGNSLIPLSNFNYVDTIHEDDTLDRTSHRTGMLLNLKELTNLAHFPTELITSGKLNRNLSKTKASPDFLENNDFVVGVNHHNGKLKEVGLSESLRVKHTHIIGVTGTGKSTLLCNLIGQDIIKGNGVCVLDPHGDLIETIYSLIPEDRFDDVIVLDPADAQFPVGLNILKAHSEVEKEILASDLVAVFRRLSTSWGDQMNSVFANAILAFLESEQGGTLFDLRRFLVEKNFRDSFLQTVDDSHIRYYWQKEFPLLKGGSVAPILTRLDSFLRPKLIRNMIIQKDGLDFEQILNSNKILLCKLSQGLIGAENSYLLGTFIVAKIHQAALARQLLAKEERKDFFLYVDEFQNFITPSMTSILSGARKYRLGLTMVHQDMQQVLKVDQELANSVMSNVGTRICFKLGDADAKRFEDGFSFFNANDLQSLGIGQAIMRVEKPECDFNIDVPQLPELEENAKVKADEIIWRSRGKYSHPLVNLETEDEKDIAVPVEPPKEIFKEKVQLPEVKEHHPVLKEEGYQATTPTERKAISEHRYLQTLIKKMAEARGYVAILEQPTEDGKGRVDVSLERNGVRIACEICVTTTDEWELHNIEKCLKSGYGQVITCANNKRTIEQIEKKIVQQLSEADQSRVLVMDVERLIHYLETRDDKEEPKETRVKGYRVKVEYESLSSEDMKRKREAVAKIVADSLKGKKAS